MKQIILDKINEAMLHIDELQSLDKCEEYYIAMIKLKEAKLWVMAKG